MYLRVQLSDPLWWGYHIYEDTEQFKNNKELIDHVLKNLKFTLESFNLQYQVEYLEKIKGDFHIHDIDIKNIVSKIDTIYVCRHNSSINLLH